MQGFLGSLLLLTVAALLYFAVVVPGSGDRPSGSQAQKDGGTAVDAGGVQPSKRQALRDASSRGREEGQVAPPTRPARSGAGEPAVEPASDEERAFAAEDPDIQRAINLIDTGNPQEALALLEGVLKRDPKNEQALVEMAMIQLLDLKSPELALGTMQKVLEVNPGNQVVLSELVSLFEDQGRMDDGLAFLSDLYQKNPGSPDLAYGVGQLLTLTGRDQEAISYYEKASAAPGNEVRALRDLAEAYARSGDSEKAVDALDRAIENLEREREDKAGRGLPTQFVDERINYARIDKARELIRLGEFDKAQSLIDAVDAAMPGDESVMALRESLKRRKAG